MDGETELKAGPEICVPSVGLNTPLKCALRFTFTVRAPLPVKLNLKRFSKVRSDRLRSTFLKLIDNSPIKANIFVYYREILVT